MWNHSCSTQCFRPWLMLESLYPSCAALHHSCPYLRCLLIPSVIVLVSTSVNHLHTLSPVFTLNLLEAVVLVLVWRQAVSTWKLLSPVELSHNASRDYPMIHLYFWSYIRQVISDKLDMILFYLCHCFWHAVWGSVAVYTIINAQQVFMWRQKKEKHT